MSREAEEFEAKTRRVQAVAAGYIDRAPVDKDFGSSYFECNHARSAAKTALNEENPDMSSVLANLEEAREARMGVKTSISDGVLIRDARGATGKKELGPEGFEMQYLNAVRAAMDIADKDPGVQDKDALKRQLLEKAKIFMAGDHDKLDAKSHKKNIHDLAKLMKESGVKDPHKKLDTAKDYQNFKDTHRDVVTISSYTEIGRPAVTIVEAEVAFKTLTPKQQKEYQQIIDFDGELPIKKGQNPMGTDGQPKELPKWFVKLKPHEQNLCKDSAPMIVAGTHVIPTQLRQIGGMRNAFNKITSLQIGKGSLEVVHEAMHAGTVASLCSDKKEAVRMTQDNVEQAQSWSGVATLHLNVLNSSLNPTGHDGAIVKQTLAAAKATGARCSVNPFNAFRKLGGEKTGDIEALSGQDESLASALAMSKVSNENRSLAISTATGRALFKIKSIGQKLLTMCASGKDRTGLAMHDQTVQPIQEQLRTQGYKARTADLDDTILRAGHTAQQAGGMHAGGATIGCFGTKSENKAGIPKSRAKELAAIMESTANTNKIKDVGIIKKVISKIKGKSSSKGSSSRAPVSISEEVVVQNARGLASSMRKRFSGRTGSTRVEVVGPQIHKSKVVGAVQNR